MIQIPQWAKEPKTRNGCVATDKGWVDAKTGEVIRKAPDLLNRLSELKELIQIEQTGVFEKIDETISKIVAKDSTEDSGDDPQESSYISTSTKEFYQNLEKTDPNEASKEIHDEFMNEVTQRDLVDPVKTLSSESNIIDGTAKSDDVNKPEEPITEQRGQIADEPVKKKRGRPAKKKDVSDSK